MNRACDAEDLGLCATLRFPLPDTSRNGTASGIPGEPQLCLRLELRPGGTKQGETIRIPSYERLAESFPVHRHPNADSNPLRRSPTLHKQRAEQDWSCPFFSGDP